MLNELILKNSESLDKLLLFELKELFRHDSDDDFNESESHIESYSTQLDLDH